MTGTMYSKGAQVPGKAQYSRMVARASRRTNVAATCGKAFCIGGGICLLGEVIRQTLLGRGLDAETAGSWTTVLLVGLSALMTGLGAYERLAKHGGAGTLVPVTGFANAVTAAAVEARTEGYVLGVGAKIFTIAGPVILYGTAASVIYGVILWLTQR